MSYAQLLTGMMEAIVNGDGAPAAALVRDNKNFPREAQLAVYTQGYRLRLREVVEATYPALRHHLGNQAFAALAAGYVEATPPRHFNLDRYPVAFAEHVLRESQDVFARDLARLESAIHAVYQAEETPAIDPAWAENRTPEALAGTSFPLRAASALLAFAYPADDYVTALRAGDDPAAPSPAQTHLLVLRQRNQVRRLPLAPGEHALLALLAEGKTLAQALDDPRFAAHARDERLAADLSGWFARWVGEGALGQPI